MLFTARGTQCSQPHGGGCKYNILKMENEILELLRSIEQNTLLQAKQVLTTDDVSRLTGLGEIQLRNLRAEKRIPYYKKTRKLVYYDKDEINAWMKENRVITIDEAREG